MHALILTGVALVGLPVVLHLIMRQEPKHLLLPTFRFLKQKRRINQRKLRLRHLLLMLMRMVLIALMCAALFQPTLISEGFNLRGEQPVAAVLVIDTSPSMGYVLAERTGLSEARQRGLKLLDESPQGPWTALDEARGRALEILEELPPNSKVAIVDTADRGESGWALRIDDARNQIRNIKKPRAASQPVTRGLEQAYSLFAKVDQELEAGQEPLPRLLVVFSDRTAPSWDPARLESLQQMRDRVPPPAIFTAYVDVGVDKPVNTAITNVELKPQIVPAGDVVPLYVTVEGTVAQDNAVECRVVGKNDKLKKPAKVSPGQQAVVDFRLEGLAPGVHQVEISLVAADAQPWDNMRYVTLRVREPRKVLAIADEPPDRFGALGGGLAVRGMVLKPALFWQIALRSYRRYACEIVSAVEAAEKWTAEDFARYEVVTLAAVETPDSKLWDKLVDYVRAGGQLVILPGERMDGYRNGAADQLLPGHFENIVEVKRNEPGVGWAWEAISYQHPLLAPFGEWRKKPDQGFVHFPPLVWRYWKVKELEKQNVLVSYADAPQAEQRRPALLERLVGKGGRVVMFTTAWDFRRDAADRPWNNYFETNTIGFYLALSNLLVRYLTGDVEDATLNFQNGQNVLVKWPVDNTTKGYYLEGPDVIGTEAILKREEGQAYLRLGPERMQSAGNFKVVSEGHKWTEGFSLNPPPQESNLERLAVDQLEPLLGKDAVAPATKDLKIREVLRGKFTQPIELFPFLMVLLLLFLALENLLANKFYKQPPPQQAAA